MPLSNRVLGVLLRFTPVICGVTYKLDVLRLLFAKKSMLKAGLNISKSAELLENLCNFELLRDAVLCGQERVEQGASFAEAFDGVLSGELYSFWVAGEQTGTEEAALDKICILLKADVQVASDLIAQWAPKIAYYGVLIFMATRVFAMIGSTTSSLGF